MKRWLLAASVVVFAGVSGPCAPPPEPTLLVTSLTAQPRVVRVGQATLVTVQAVIPDFPGLIPPSVNLVDVTGFKPVVVKRMDASGQIYSASFEVDPEETGRRRYQVTAAFAQEVERKKSRILEIPVFEPASSLEPMEESLVEGDAGDVFPVDQLVVNFVPGANRFRVEMLAGFVAEEVSDLLLTPVVLEIVGFFPKTNGYQFELRCEGDTLPLSVCASGQDVEDLLVALEAARQAFEASPIVQGANRNVFVFPEADFDSLTSTQQSGFNRAGIPGGWQAIADAVAAGDIPAEVLSKTVELGVLDVGIDVEHPDLDGVSYRSPRTGESPQAPPNCLVSYPDNTSQGCNDQPLWCVSAPICSASIRARNVQGVDNQLFTRHGSFVTGLLAGDDGDRASGGEMNGVATGAPVGPLEFRIELGRSAAELHASLDRVTDTANVVNLSIGWHSDGSCDSTSMDDFATIKGHFEEFISHEDNQDVLFVASAGNCDVDLNPAGSPAHVPGGLAFPNLLTVGASYDDGGTETKAAFSNDMASPPADFHMLWAPGVGLYGPRGGLVAASCPSPPNPTCGPNDGAVDEGYTVDFTGTANPTAPDPETGTGTSGAAALVSGVAALMYAVDCARSTTPGDVIAFLESSGVSPGPDGSPFPQLDARKALADWVGRDEDLDSLSVCQERAAGTSDQNPDSDNDGVLDPDDLNPSDASSCADADGDSCDDCSVTGASGSPNPANDGPDFDGDGLCDDGDSDIDGDGVANEVDVDDRNRLVCQDTDADGCDDCSIDGSSSPANDGPDFDSDGTCDDGDADDDGDGVPDAGDSAPRNRFQCQDTDADGCDDCSIDGSSSPANDGSDLDSDGTCDDGDADDDGDGVPDAGDSAPRNRFQCQDTDADTCDDCSVAGVTDPANDGPDADLDGICDDGDSGDDPDDDPDGDGVPNSQDSFDNDRFRCRDLDGDTCDDCSSGTDLQESDGPDLDADGLCDAGDPDIDGDTVANAFDQSDFDRFVCRDLDGDDCDDCSQIGFPDTSNDGRDSGGDGICDAGESTPPVADCVPVDSDNLSVVSLFPGFFGVRDPSRILSFFDSSSEAQGGRDIIASYGFDERCTIGGLSGMVFWLIDGFSPRGNRAGDDCIPFSNPTIRTSPGDGFDVIGSIPSSILLEFTDDSAAIDFDNALQSVRAMNFQDFDQQCFVGRPGNALQYYLGP